jgi:hypothetical protein
MQEKSKRYDMEVYQGILTWASDMQASAYALDLASVCTWVRRDLTGAGG